MFISKNVYQTRLHFVDLPDLDFFSESLRYALNDDLITLLSEVEVSEIKENLTPVVFFSVFSKQSKEEVVINRGEIEWDRARRRFIMLDMDFEKGQEELSELTRKKIINLANYYKTPVLIYPTISFPTKPRYRVVFFTKRLLNEASYYQAVYWLQHQIGLPELTDAFDSNIKMNRNLPIFNNFKQAKNVYSTMNKDGLEPLNNSLWKEMPKPKRLKAKKYSEEEKKVLLSNEKIDSEVLFEAIEYMKKTDFLKTYNTFWGFVNSLAQASILGQVDPDIVDDILLDVAGVTNNDAQRKYWESENIKLYNNQYKRLVMDETQLLLARPLKTYTEIKYVLNERKGKGE